ncbi:potassium channel family protein [Pantoea trifolii]|uniref:Potassium channel family protein n=1 Tax=Pantoea trifolii TaxID=2968030 RepID=A0ABT1VNF8_9GAMM|nr:MULTISPECIES: potassium channel family protein [unclassified Pantoea]MCQ8228706.1 potassium channel family protein [Pantoea sp. MMK2]MCQ8236879.1 potassium channel family protein [Pantoea sp. MMK3]
MKKMPLQTEHLISDDDESSVNPPDVKYELSSTIGKLIQKATYIDLIIGAIIAILLASTLITLFGKLNNSDGFIDSIYYSFVTFTTLGYGDLTPVGFARFISVLLTLSGLLFTSLLIGKFASERQQAMLLLIHTSDCQRRIDAFCIELYKLNDELISAFSAQNVPLTQSTLKTITSRFEASSNYIIFHANQSDLTGFGNDSVLMKFYHVLNLIQESCHTIQTHKQSFPDELIFNRSLALAKRSCSLISIMYKLHVRSMKSYGYTDALLIKVKNKLPSKEVNPRSLSSLVTVYNLVRLFIYNKLENITATKEYNDNDSLLVGIRKIKRLMQERLSEIIVSHKTIINPKLLNEVYDLMPEGNKTNWGKGIHRSIAANLTISNRLAQSAIDTLIAQKKLPRYPRR